MTRRAFTATIANRPIHLLTIAAATTLWQAGAFAAQTWTYQFTPTSSQPYNVICGECIGIVSSNADVAGTFTILLDWDNHKGKILELDDYLMNVVDVINTDTGIESVPSNPPTKDYGIIPPENSRPIFVPTTINYANGLGHMKSDGRYPASRGRVSNRPAL